MKFSTFYKKLTAAGYNPEMVTLQNVTPTGGSCEAIKIAHDYRGTHPTREALAAYEAITSAARKSGFFAAQRGHYTATYVYNMTPAEYLDTRRAWEAL